MSRHDGAGHPELGPELRQLAQAILDRLDPAVRAAAAAATEALRGPGRCQQVWCPVCALAALAGGEQHPLLSVIAEHSVTLMAAVRTLVTDPPGGAGAPGPAPGGGSRAAAPDAETGSASVRYHDIPIVIEDIPIVIEDVQIGVGTVAADD